MINYKTILKNIYNGSTYKSFVLPYLLTSRDYFTANATEGEFLSNIFVDSSKMGLSGLWSKPTDFIASMVAYPFYIPYKADLTFLQFSNVPLIDVKTTVPVSACPVDYDRLVFNMGQHYVGYLYGDYLDYNGYSKTFLQLPFLGSVELNTNEVLGKYIQITLSIDLISAKGIYYITTTQELLTKDSISGLFNDLDSKGVLINTYETDLGVTIPIGSTNSGDVLRNLILGTVKTTAMVAASASPSTRIAETSHQSINPETKRLRTDYKTTVKSTQTRPHAKADIFNSALDAVNMHMTSSISDRTSNISTRLDDPYVYIIRKIPIATNITADYLSLYGAPYGNTNKLKNMSGYTEVTSVHVEGDGFKLATSGECEEIKSLLFDGVILPTSTTPISFYIDGVKYSATPTSTWEQWVSSSYNTGSYGINVDGFVIRTSDGWYVQNDNREYVTYDMTIISERQYNSIPYGITKFTVEGVTHYFNYPSTWNEWLNSSLSDDTFNTEQEGTVSIVLKNNRVLKLSSRFVLNTDNISASTSYTLHSKDIIGFFFIDNETYVFEIGTDFRSWKYSNNGGSAFDVQSNNDVIILKNGVIYTLYNANGTERIRGSDPLINRYTYTLK